jgi:hypothetical protein
MLVKFVVHGKTNTLPLVTDKLYHKNHPIRIHVPFELNLFCRMKYFLHSQILGSVTTEMSLLIKINP